MSRRLRRRTCTLDRRTPGTFGTLALAGLLGGAAWVSGPQEAAAAVEGKEGLEIEGPRDRRGFYIAPSLAFGGTVFDASSFVPFGGLHLALGGGLTKRFTLGLDAHASKYFGAGQGFLVGGDLEATGFVFKGLYVRGAVGAQGMPKADGDSAVIGGFGGAAGLGYEVWINSTVALGMGLVYDLRASGEGDIRHTGMVGLRFTFY